MSTETRSDLRPVTLAGRNGLVAPIAAMGGIDRLPFSLRILLENVIRRAALANREAGQEAADLLARRRGASLSFYPTRVFGQDILGKVMLVDLAGLRDALADAGADPELARPRVPVDIIIDHSLQVDHFARPDAAALNLAHEYRRNRERFQFLRWCAESFPGVRVVPPGKGIMHQLHLEAIGRVVWEEASPRGTVFSPDTCVGTDSHTPMINGLGILGWGVGGIEAEATMLGRAIAMALPEVVGVEVQGRLGDGVSPTDLVLTITERLRAAGVVDSFVEFFGRDLDGLSVADRGTIANMAPEYGATAVYFPIDRRTIGYLSMTARDEAHVRLVEAYARAQRLWRDETVPVPEFDRVITLDLAKVRPSISGPKNPEERHDLDMLASLFPRHVEAVAGRPIAAVPSRVDGEDFTLRDGHVVIAAITSCTNTSNPAAMIAAGLLAQKAAARGLRSKPWVKTSLAPGSHVAAAALDQAGLQPSLDALGFHVVGFGCTTCNGGSGPLAIPIADAIARDRIAAAAVISGNRNFLGRIHPSVTAGYLASPALVVAYAIAGSMQVDLTCDPLGTDTHGQPVLLRDIWPSTAEIDAIVARVYAPDVFRAKYADLFEGGEAWDELATGASKHYAWDPKSSYVRRPPYFDGLARECPPVRNITGARALAILGDNITTDHISPSGAISLGTPAADFMQALGIAPRDFNNYTTRRSNHEIAVRATFANIRLRNLMLPGREGGITRLEPDGRDMRIFDAAKSYRQRGVPLVVIAGRNYGCGSSRDWAAKGVALLGVKAIIAESFERIHRANLVGMGVLPLELPKSVTAPSLAFDGSETFDVTDLAAGASVNGRVTLHVHRPNGQTESVPLTARLDTPEDVYYWRNGGILPAVWREIVGTGARGNP